ncbi:MAG: leucine-rich repeat domain-containing protein [Lachnospiraceae bacterium]
MKKKLLSILLALCVVTGTVTASPEQMIVKAAENTTEDTDSDFWKDCYLKLDDGTIEICDFPTGTTMGSIIIPSEIDGKKVTAIGGSAFNDCDSLTSVTLPNSITRIGSGAFAECGSLTSIKIPDSVTTIGENAFFECVNLTSVTLPKSITRIEENTFGDCKSLTSIMIPNSVTAIENNAFDSCSSLTSVTIPDSVTAIENNAFNYCSSLTSVIIPDSVTAIGSSAFDGCSSLTSVTLPNSITRIEENAFSACKSLTSITIPASVQEIASGAFSWCENLKQVVLLNPNTQIDQTAFTHTLWQDQNQTAADSNSSTTTEPTTYVLSNVSPSVKSVIYNGGEQKPSVVVMDTAGQVKDASNYTITYSNNVNVGQATITVTGIGNCTGTVTATFTILPKGTKLSKVTAKKKKALVKWKKQTAQTTGYQIQYGRNAKFNGAKITTIKKNKTASATLKKLKAKKKYYVRIRTYKNVQINGRSTQLYSNWSKAKTVKVK